MRSVLLAPPGTATPRAPLVRLVERPRPKPGPGEVLLRVAACGLCGSDFSACRFDREGRPDFSGPLRLPVVLGHEAAGTVEAMGEGVRRVHVGGLVAVESVLSCWSCDTCLSGRPAQCERAELLGLTCDGALADWMVVPERSCFRLDPLLAAGFSPAHAAIAGALLEPFGVAYSALFLCGRPTTPGESLLVYGLGALGALVGALGRLSGCSPIVGVDRDPAKREWAAMHGFDAAIAANLGSDPPSVIESDLRRRLGRDGFDLQIDASGCAAAVVPVAQRLLAAGGRLTVLSRARGAVPVELDPWISAAADLQGVRGRVDARAFARLVALVAGGRLDPREHIANAVPLEAAPGILLAEGSRPPGKTVVMVGVEDPG